MLTELQAKNAIFQKFELLFSQLRMPKNRIVIFFCAAFSQDLVFHFRPKILRATLHMNYPKENFHF